MPRIIIVGAGWAGLTCAYQLAKAGQQVTVLEAAPQIGGRARSIRFQDQLVDNGQHICLGAYQHTLGLMRELNLDPSTMFQRLPLQIYGHGSENFNLKLPNLPTPMNLLSGLLMARNIDWRDKARIAHAFWQMRRHAFRVQPDCTVLQLLQHYRQTPWLIKTIWEPLALGAMTTPIDQGSAQIFLNILRLSFGTDPNHSNWLLPRHDLTQMLPVHLAQQIQALGGEIICNEPVKALQFQDNRCIGVSTRNQTWTGAHIVLAIQPWQAKMLSSLPEFAVFSYQPITTIYVACETPVRLPYPILSLNGLSSHWIFDRSFAGQPKIASMVISGHGPHMAIDHQQLFHTVQRELSDLFPVFSRINDYLIVREKRAAFTCDVQTQAQRPAARTMVNNLWLSGDYLQTGLPATLEGAIMSGYQTAVAVKGSISPRSNHNC